MSPDVEQIAEDLLKLPSSLRAKLAERLLESAEEVFQAARETLNDSRGLSS